MGSRLRRLGVAGCAILLMLGLVAGCGGTTASVGVTPSPSGPITNAQALAYAHAVNLQPGELPGFTSSGGETQAPKPGRLALEEIRCSGAVNPDRQIAQIDSTELSAGRAIHARIIKSTVGVWPTPALVADNNNPLRKSRARSCFVRFHQALNEPTNRERRFTSIGRFTVTTVSNPLPGVSNSFLTTMNEARLRRSGAVLIHIYTDIFGFTSGPAEIELEAVGFGHPIPSSTEARALQPLLARATAHAI